MATDWQDALRALLPDEPVENEAPDSSADSDDACDGTTAQKERLDIVLERKGRAGKTATIVTGFIISDADVRNVAARLKSALGTGGSARGGEILIQGDRRNDVLRLLTSFGYRARII